MKIDTPLHLKYRPQSFDEVIGNKGTVESLKSILARKKGRPHSLLFSGPAGCGKTTLARIIKNELGCSDRDFHELNAANTRGIDTIREVGVNCQYSPSIGSCKIYLLDEAHKLTVDAQNGMLKPLEDTPLHVYFILCTTEPEKLIEAVRQRCTKFKVATQRRADITKLLNFVLESEGVEDFPVEAVKEIAKVAGGSPRNALVILDSVIDIEDPQVVMSSIIDFVVKQSSVKDLCEALLANKKWSEISKILSTIDSEPENVRYAVLGWMNTVLLKSGDVRAAEIIVNFMEPMMYTKKAGLTYACFACTSK
jgi:DNA polymerase III subunit gamma/tau